MIINKTITVSENSQKRYEVNVHDATGVLIKSTKANSIKQENNMINMLPSGLYIIKTPSGFRKIAK
ncbi:T9SS type A sorting domain-containing protein [Flavivirga sp. 57AJ16]|uniref:T9SS type A sorting domain-containing protein n=1 Tax=Flavivirga sp. 57AJ16 TaxID=3025307 RepID=UPI0034DFF240